MNFIRRLLHIRTKQPKSISDVEVPQQWTLHKTEDNGKPVIVIKNESSEITTRHNQRYPISCCIIFKLLQPRLNGLPNLQAEPRLKQLDSDIFELFESDLQSIIPMVISTAGVRQYVIYTDELAEFNDRLNKIRAKYREYRFITCNETDINWETYQSII